MRVDTSGAGGVFNQNRGRNASVILDGAWHQMVFTLDNGNWAEYLDGTFVQGGTYNHGGGLFNNQPLLIGGRGSPNMNGNLDDLGVFNQALTAGQALSIHPFATEASLLYDLGR